MKLTQLHIVFFIGIAGITVLCGRAEAQKMTMSTYYPSPVGEYSKIRFPPRVGDLSGVCTIGTLYTNSTNILRYCQSNAGVGGWGSISDTWTQNEDNIYLTDSIANPALLVGIGTTHPKFKLSLLNNGGIVAKGTYGSGVLLPDGLGAASRLIWYPRKAAFRAGYVSGAQWDDANIGDYSAAMGKDSTASGIGSVVGGGDNNTASGLYSNVIGGQDNIASGLFSAITGGYQNAASGSYTTVIGGHRNTASANYAVIYGGFINQVSEIFSVCGGGSINVISLPYSNINGGQNNNITRTAAAIAGYSVIGGGQANNIEHEFGVVSGGSNNFIACPYCSIGGGDGNREESTGAYSRISGGFQNVVSTNYSTLSGGDRNTVSGDYGTVVGGSQNTAKGNYSAVGGGQSNTTNGISAMIFGGRSNVAGGDFSWAGGRNMRPNFKADRSFAWGYSDAVFVFTTPDVFIIASGTNGGSSTNPKVGIRDVAPAAVLEINGNATADDYINIKSSSSGDIFLLKNNGYLGIRRPAPTDNTYAMQVGTNASNGNGAFLSGGGTWTSSSSRVNKENIKPLSLESAENTLDQLQPVIFNYKVTPPGEGHANVGFIAEDVPDLVAMRGRDKLSTMDIIAVLTKTAQDQEKQITKQGLKIEKLKTDIETLKNMLGNQ